MTGTSLIPVQPQILFVAVREQKSVENTANRLHSLAKEVAFTKKLKVVVSTLFSRPEDREAYHTEKQKVAAGVYQEIWFVGSDASTRLLSHLALALTKGEHTKVRNFAERSSQLNDALTRVM